MYKNIKISTVFIILLIVSGCKKEAVIESLENTDSEVLDSTKITSNDVSKISYTDYALSDLATKKTSDWESFRELSNKIEALKSGDLSFFRDDKAILEGFLTDLKNEVPKDLNSTAIQVRLTVIKTVFLKLEGLASLSSAKKEDLLISIKDVLLSHTNLIFQINKKLEKESQNIEKPTN